jgi:hypothetical protein
MMNSIRLNPSMLAKVLDTAPALGFVDQCRIGRPGVLGKKHECRHALIAVGCRKLTFSFLQ